MKKTSALTNIWIYCSIINGIILLMHFIARAQTGFFNLDVEQNASSLWMGVQLMSAATFAFICAAIVSRTKGGIKDFLPFVLVGFSFIYIGIDDMTMFHERLGFVLNNALGIGGFYGESFNWLFYYSPLIALAIAVYTSVYTFLRKERTVAAWWFAGAVVLWLFALATEYAGGAILTKPDANVILYQQLIVVEEALELFGATGFVAGFGLFMRELIVTHIRIV